MRTLCRHLRHVVLGTAIPHAIPRLTMPYYAVAAGREIGIFHSWDVCQQKVKGFPKAKYKKFGTLGEAEEFLDSHKGSCNKISKTFDPRTVAVSLRNISKTSGLKPDSKGTAGRIESPKKEEPPKSEGSWPEYVPTSNEDDELLVGALDEIEALPGVSRKRKHSTSPVNEKRKKNSHDSVVWEPIGLKNFKGVNFPINSDGYVIVYTDGSCINNGRTNSSAGFGVYFYEGHPENVGLPVKGRVTNNVGEIQAAIHAIQVAKKFAIDRLCLSTDSQFLINSVTTWMKGWKKKGWKLQTGKPVKNVDEFKVLDKVLDGSIDVKWNYVKAHKGIPGNEKADELARHGSALYAQMEKK